MLRSITQHPLPPHGAAGAAVAEDVDGKQRREERAAEDADEQFVGFQG